MTPDAHRASQGGSLSGSVGSAEPIVCHYLVEHCRSGNAPVQFVDTTLAEKAPDRQPRCAVPRMPLDPVHDAETTAPYEQRAQGHR